MRLASLGSGSGGNATLVEGADTRLLIDCGFGPRVTQRRLRALGVEPESLQAIVVTHEHIDHVRGVARLAARYGLPVHATAGTARAWPEAPSGLHVLDAHRAVRIGGVTLEPFPVVHDAAEPCQLVASDGRFRFALLTDTGTVTPHIRSMLAGCDGLLLECNHDAAMLRTGPYPVWVQDRIASRFGHLDNRQAAALLGDLDVPRLQWVMAGHLSARNNSVEAVCDALHGAVAGTEAVVHVLGQEGDARWRELC